MKFRAVMTDGTVMKEFMNISSTLSKLSKQCVMRITQRKIYFIISEEGSGPKNPLAWCELSVGHYFAEYNLVGVSEDYNEIYLELSTSLLARSLSQLEKGVRALKMKLTNKDIPCLTLEMEINSGNLQHGQCVHDIPVETISRKHWKDYEEPRFDDFHVSIGMPSLKSIKAIVERMKSMSSSLIISATKNGCLTLQIQTPMITMSAHCPDLNIQSFAVGDINFSQNSENSGEDSEKVCSVIDIKKFLMFLSGMQAGVQNSQTSCSIVHGKMVKLFMEQPGVVSLQVFLTQLSS